jgi:hypothetical protein
MNEMENGMELVVVLDTMNLGKADMVKSMLAGAGLHAEVTHENSALTNAYSLLATGVHVVVPLSEADEARSLIAAEGFND